MTKPLEELLSSACDVEEAGKLKAAVEILNFKSLIRDDAPARQAAEFLLSFYQAGAREMASRLVPVIREALDVIKVLSGRDHIHVCAIDKHSVDDCYEMDIEDIRKILEKAGSKDA